MNTLEFNSTQVPKPKRNFFDMSHERKFSFNMGHLVPILCQEILPGDTFSVVNQQLLRFAPMLAPIMHKVDVYTHYFFVPNRIVWDQWDEFITGNNGQAPEPVLPYINFTKCDSGSIADYMGCPVTNNYPQGEKILAFPFAGLNKIWNEFYRDQNLQTTELFCDLVDGDNTATLNYVQYTQPPKRSWEHDYFTSCLPWTQKGQEVMLTFDTEASVPITFAPDPITGNFAPDHVRSQTGGVPTSGFLETDVYGNPPSGLLYNGQEYVTIDNSANLEVDLSGSYLMTVNQLRQAMALQRWLELNARAGSRYIETILAHFGTRSADARLQRPEYLGGGKSNVAISEVLQMSESSTTPQGTMAGHGINYGESHEFKASFTEHGYVIGLISVRPTTAYQQGLPRHFSKLNKFDYFWPTLAHLGEQAVKNKELYIEHSQPEGDFGYLPRYSEYKTINSSVHGDFTGNLDFWHMGRIFNTEPNLNSDFIECNPTTRIFAVTAPNIHHIWCHMYQQVKAIRPIPVFSTPLLNG